MSRLKSLRHRGLLITQCSTILCRSRLGLLWFFHLPVCLDSPRPHQLATSYPCVCPYIYAMHSRLVQMQPEVRLAGPGPPILRARSNTMPTDGRCIGQRFPRRCRCSSGSQREWISQWGRRRCCWCRVALSCALLGSLGQTC